jgi:hypothetical protein
MTSLTVDRLRELLDYSPASGQFTWLTTRGRAGAGSVAGAIHKYGYQVIQIDGKGYGAHRLAWLFIYGDFPEVIDHINGDRADNRIENLRNVDHQINAENRKGPRLGKKIALMGVKKQTVGNSFWASIKVKGEVVALGGFPTAELAHEAYMAAKAKYHVGVKAAFA